MQTEGNSYSAAGNLIFPKETLHYSQVTGKYVHNEKYRMANKVIRDSKAKYRFHKFHRKTFMPETLIQVFFCEFCKIFQDSLKELRNYVLRIIRA